MSVLNVVEVMCKKEEAIQLKQVECINDTSARSVMDGVKVDSCTKQLEKIGNCHPLAARHFYDRHGYPRSWWSDV